MKRLLLILMMLVPAMLAGAKPTDQKNAKEARALFDKVYNLVFGEQGSSLSYSVNLIGIYKTEGDIYYKKQKIQYSESRYAAWEDGKLAYMVDKKKKTVDIYRFDDDAKDEYLSKFKYDVDNFEFSYKIKGNQYELHAKVKDAKFFGIREATALLDRKTLAPQALTIKLAFIRTMVKISNFKSGGIDDKVFIFPKERFKDYTYTDHRNEKKKK